MRSEGCRDLIFIGSLVRPALSEIRLDWGTLRVMGNVVAAFRGGDDHLLSGIGRILEQDGFRMVGIKDVAPDLLMPKGCLTRAAPDEAARRISRKGGKCWPRSSPFDIGQAVGRDRRSCGRRSRTSREPTALLVRVARLREEGRIRAKAGRGVLVKVPKSGQDLRYDLPTLGPRTIEGAADAGLAGIAVAAGNTLVAEPQALVEAADAAGLFVTGLPRDRDAQTPDIARKIFLIATEESGDRSAPA